jgi:hypothetical protein
VQCSLRCQTSLFWGFKIFLYGNRSLNKIMIQKNKIKVQVFNLYLFAQSKVAMSIFQQNKMIKKRFTVSQTQTKMRLNSLLSYYVSNINKTCLVLVNLSQLIETSYFICRSWCSNSKQATYSLGWNFSH